MSPEAEAGGVFFVASGLGAYVRSFGHFWRWFSVKSRVL